MTPEQRAIKAAKIASYFVLGIAALFAGILGVIVLTYKLFGAVGLIVLWTLATFVVFWICAMLDLRDQEGRK